MNASPLRDVSQVSSTAMQTNAGTLTIAGWVPMRYGATGCRRATDWVLIRGDQEAHNHRRQVAAHGCTTTQQLINWGCWGSQSTKLKMAYHKYHTEADGGDNSCRDGYKNSVYKIFWWQWGFGEESNTQKFHYPRPQWALVSFLKTYPTCALASADNPGV